MTREEVIEQLQDAKDGYKEYLSNDALDIAIKALEHPEKNVIAVVPCEDTISRQSVIDFMMQKWGENFSGDDAMQESIDAIRVMPSVTPQNQVYPLCEDCRTKMDEVRRAYDNEMKQESILDKLRAEIIENSIEDYKYHGCGTDELIIETSEVLRVLDKYKGESENP